MPFVHEDKKQIGARQDVVLIIIGVVIIIFVVVTIMIGNVIIVVALVILLVSALPHGVANAILLPTVMEYNAEAAGEKYRDIAKAMGVKDTEKMSAAQYRKAACDAVRQLSLDVGIPRDLKNIVKAEDVPFLAESAMADACRPGNPKEPTYEDIVALYRKLM